MATHKGNKNKQFISYELTSTGKGIMVFGRNAQGRAVELQLDSNGQLIVASSGGAGATAANQLVEIALLSAIDTFTSQTVSILNDTISHQGIKTIVSAEFICDAATYTAGDVINETNGGNAIQIPAVASITGYGRIVSVKIQLQNIAFAGTLRVHIFSSNLGGYVNGDPIQITMAQAELYMGYIDMPAAALISSDADFAMSQVVNAGLGFAAVGSGDLFIVVTAQSGFVTVAPMAVRVTVAISSV